MNIEQFREKLIAELNKRAGDKYAVIPCETLKNNGVKLIGVILRENSKKIAPAIYIENIFSQFEQHGDITAAADEVIKLNSEYEVDGFDTGFYEDFERVKRNIYVKLISRYNNLELLMDTPHRDFMDLSLIVYCDVSSLCKFDASIVVKDTHIKQWGVREYDVIETAIENTRKLGCRITDITKVLTDNSLIGDSSLKDMSVDRKMFVMTTRTLFFGAICMTYDDRLDDFCNKHRCNTYIIPSSIHEVILLPDTGEYSDREINSMVKDVNDKELRQDEILSDHAYYYSVRDGYLCV